MSLSGGPKLNRNAARSRTPPARRLARSEDARPTTPLDNNATRSANMAPPDGDDEELWRSAPGETGLQAEQA